MENPPSETLLVTEEETEPIQDPPTDAPAAEGESESMDPAPEPEDDGDPDEAPEAAQGDAAPDGGDDPSQEPGAPTEGQESSEEPVAEPEPEPLKLGPGEKKSDEELRVEATTLLFASSDALTEHRLTVLLERPQAARVKAVLAELQVTLVVRFWVELSV